MPADSQQEPNGPKTNGKLALLNTLASSGDNWVKIGTLVLVAISGGGNFLATTKTSEYNAEEIRRGLAEIHDLHDALQSTLDRQKDMYDIVRRLERRSLIRGGGFPDQPPTPVPSPH
jgi:hypothetical protein